MDQRQEEGRQSLLIYKLYPQLEAGHLHRGANAGVWHRQQVGKHDAQIPVTGNDRLLALPRIDLPLSIGNDRHVAFVVRRGIKPRDDSCALVAGVCHQPGVKRPAHSKRPVFLDDDILLDQVAGIEQHPPVSG